jgi:hypothetical protein
VVVDAFVVQGAIKPRSDRHTRKPGYMICNRIERTVETFQSCAVIIVIAKLSVSSSWTRSNRVMYSDDSRKRKVRAGMVGRARVSNLHRAWLLKKGSTTPGRTAHHTVW